MLKIINYNSRDQIHQVLEQELYDQSTWIVSDLKSKLELQNFFLHKRGFFIEDQVLRASDFWKLLLRKINPGLNPIQPVHFKTFLQDIIEKNSDILNIHSLSTDTTLAYMNGFAPLLFHPEAEKIFLEWKNEKAKEDGTIAGLYEVFLKCKFLKFQLVDQLKIILPAWIPSYLQSFKEIDQFWNKPLLVDLSSQLKKMEADLFLQISQKNDVFIFYPQTIYEKQYPFLLKPYLDLKPRTINSTLAQTDATSTEEKKKHLFYKFSGPLAEVKFAVSLCRKHLADPEIRPQDIAILAPDIETYAPLLQEYFIVEGIPVQKSESFRLQNSLSVQRWLSRLKNFSYNVQFSHLENIYDADKNLNYDDFKSKYKNVQFLDDLQDPELHRLFQKDHLIHSEYNRHDFINAAKEYWSDVDFTDLEILIKEFYKQAPVQISLSWSRWVQYLEKCAAYKEKTLLHGNICGIQLQKIMSASSLNCKYQIFLGLSENAFKVDSVFSGLNLQWTSDLGFDLIDPLQNPLEFECRLLLESKQVQSYLCYPATDFLGQINSPSRFWLQLQKTQNLSIIEEAMAPEETRWDQLQKQHAELPSIANHTTNEEIQIPNPIKLSPSSFESYIKCPFTFAAQKLFLLKDLPDIDLDVDRRTLGQLAHALLDALLTEKTDLNWTDAQIDVLLKQLKTEKNIIIWENSIWDSISSKYLQLAKKFILAEKKQRESFPEATVLGCEIPFKFDLQIADQAYHFSGVIDRIDKNKSNQLVIYDYKMTSGFLKSYGQWLKVKQIQLLFYAWVIDKKYISNADGSVIGLFYYILKDLTKKGFYINDLAGSLFSASSRKDANLTENNLKKFIEDFEIVLFENLQKIGQGIIAPEPHDEQMCESCHWKDICRAQHLN